MVDDSIVRPKPFQKNAPSFSVYIPFDPLPSFFREVMERTAPAGFRYRDGQVIFSLPGGLILYQVVGAPAAVLWLERLIASGVKKILLLSFCGSLSPELTIGEAVVLTRAISEEGTSGHYFRRRKVFRPSSSLSQEVEETLRRLGLPFSEAVAVSTDASYRETPAWLRRMREKRADVVDMEASAVFALAEYRRVEAAALMVVSDELFSGVWNFRFPAALIRERMDGYFVPFLSRLGKQRSSQT